MWIKNASQNSLSTVSVLNNLFFLDLICTIYMRTV